MWAIEKRVSDPPEDARQTLLQGLLKEDGVRKEFLEELLPETAIRIDPASIELAWNRINNAGVRDSQLNLLMDYGSNMAHYLTVQDCLRSGSLPTLLLWGEFDQYLSPEAAHAYKRDLPNAEFNFLDGGHWLLESHPAEVPHLFGSFSRGIARQEAAFRLNSQMRVATLTHEVKFGEFLGFLGRAGANFHSLRACCGERFQERFPH